MSTSSTSAPDTESRGLRHSIAPRVFVPSAALILAFVVVTIAAPTAAENAIQAVQNFIVRVFGWYYILIVSAFVIFSVYLGVSRFGDITLGPDNEQPEFRVGSWLAMLFSAGMGIGLVFWGVAEPLWHFASPKPGSTGSATEMAQQAVVQSFLHWGLHPWAIYVIIGLAIAYAVHRKGRPVSIRWALEPLLGERVNGWLGDVIDIAAVVGTLFGVATSLGLGALQIGAGLSFLGIVDESTLVYIVLIAAITLFATLSVASGLKRGIKWLSNINVGIGGALMLFVLIAGPTLFIAREFVQSLGLYLQNLFAFSFDVTALQGAAGLDWQATWTIFYWGWWISWAPFVGVFIARISRGRTVREFVFGVLLIPTIVTFVWFSTLGGAGLVRELFGSGGFTTGNPEQPVNENAALFQLLGGFPGGSIVSVVAIVLITMFFVTSSDSGSLVVDMLSSGGNPEPPLWSRVFWAVLEGAVAAALLVAGGLTALRTGAVTIALPFSVIMVAMCFAVYRELRQERRSLLRAQRQQQREELTEHVSRELSANTSTRATTPPAR